MRIFKPFFLLMFSCISISGLRAQVPGSIKQYVANASTSWKRSRFIQKSEQEKDTGIRK